MTVALGRRPLSKGFNPAGCTIARGLPKFLTAASTFLTCMGLDQLRGFSDGTIFLRLGFRLKTTWSGQPPRTLLTWTRLA
jgi:hypothetical protein